MLEIVDADPTAPGVQIHVGKTFATQGFVALNRADNASGTLDFAATLVAPAKPIEGALRVASFDVVGLKQGDTEIAFDVVKLASTQARAIKVESTALALSVMP